MHRDFPRAAAQAGEMPQCLPLEGEEGADSEEREDSSQEDPKEIITLAFVSENTGVQEGLQDAQQQGKKKRKKKRLGLKDGEWGSMLLGAEGTWGDGALATNESSRDVVCAENFKITSPSVHRRRIHLTMFYRIK